MPGKPRPDRDSVRTVTVHVRLTEADAATVRRAAAAAGLDVSDYVRARVLGAGPRRLERRRPRVASETVSP
jgi:uncharacterized protein (DUF1778 family)